MKLATVVAAILFTTMLPLYLWWSDVQNDRKYNLVVISESELFEFPPQDYPKENHVVGKVNSSSRISVLRMGYGKDFRTWKVKTESEIEGWLIEDGTNIKINP
jgi:hypothetical protein